ncbi:MAG: FAD-dependent oxidoreductase [Mycolicibacterium sp.]|nr:FAD-dependent oxidoreductase [Mycolicibacterium sp.]
MAVVGAGLTGLVAARELARRDIGFVVLEAADRVGGRALSAPTALGSTVDLGGQWIGHDHHRLKALIDDLGATRYPMHTGSMPVLIDGPRRLTPAAPSVLTAAAALAGVAALARTGVPTRWNSQTLQTWLDRVPGRTARRLLELLALVSWTADLDRLSPYAMARMVRHQGGVRTMLATAGGAQDSLLVEGIGSLADRLAAGLGSRIRLGHRVDRVSASGGRILLDTTAGRFDAARAIITIPPPAASRIAFAPPLPPAIAGLQRNTVMGSAYKAVAVYPRPFWREGPGGEFIVLDDPGFAVFDSSPPGGPGHLTLLSAGPRARRLAELDPAARRNILLGPLRHHISSDVLEPAGWHEKFWHLDAFVGGGYSALPIPGTFEGIPPTASSPTGNLHWAGTETAADHAGYFEGAIESGLRAARETADELGR